MSDVNFRLGDLKPGNLSIAGLDQSTRGLPIPVAITSCPNELSTRPRNLYYAPISLRTYTHTRMYIHTAKSYQRIRAAQGVPFEHEGSCPRAQVPSFIIADKQTTRELHARERDNVASLTKPQIIITDACSPS